MLIVEVASEHTWRHDVNLADGKAAGYLAMGVSHYLVFDPSRAFLGEACRGWRLDNTRRVPGRAVAWRPDRMGRYRCAPLGVALLAEGSFLRVIDATDTLVPSRSERIYALFERLEQSEALVRRNAELAGRNRARRWYGGTSSWRGGTSRWPSRTRNSGRRADVCEPRSRDYVAGKDDGYGRCDAGCTGASVDVA